jgi:hypothetical protein
MASDPRNPGNGPKPRTPSPGRRSPSHPVHPGSQLSSFRREGTLAPNTPPIQTTLPRLGRDVVAVAPPHRPYLGIFRPQQPGPDFRSSQEHPQGSAGRPQNLILCSRFDRGTGKLVVGTPAEFREIDKERERGERSGQASEVDPAPVDILLN